MLEKDIVKTFCENLSGINSALDIDSRIYSIEMPIKTLDGVKYSDVVLEVLDDSGFRDKQLYVLEFKKDKIDYHSVISQVKRYSHFIIKQLYKTKPAVSVIVAPDFSRWELRSAKLEGVTCLQFDTAFNIRKLI